MTKPDGPVRRPRTRLAQPRRPAPKPDAAAALTTSKPTEAAMPHERDETAGMTDGVPSARIRQGARDLKRGVQDTSRATEADAAYSKLKK